jgi:dGTPase
VVTALERPYPGFDGLNLTFETLEGLVKHNGPLTDRAGRAIERHGKRDLPRGIAEYCHAYDLELWSYPSAEAQAGAISDDIAYDAHDIDDGLRAEMFGIEDITAVPLIGDILRGIDKDHPHVEQGRRVHELRRRLITRMIEDVIAQTLRNVAERGINSAAAVRSADRPMVTFSPAMAEADRAIKDFLYQRLYRTHGSCAS